MDIRHAINLIEGSGFTHEYVEQAVEILMPWLLDGGDFEAELDYLINQYKSETGIGTDDDDEEMDDDKWMRRQLHGDDEVDRSVVDTDHFKDWLHSYCTDRVYDAACLIDDCIKGNHIPGTRVITAPADWKPDAQHPGIYWSWDRSAAQAHWGSYGDGNVEWTMTADLPLTSVNWPFSLAANAHPSYNEEKEIRLNDDAPVENLRAKRRSRK